jgi:hypothetical protein
MHLANIVDVRFSVVIGAKADMGRTAQNVA